MESLRYRNLEQGLEKFPPALRNYVSEALSFDAGPEALSGLRSHAREALLETLPLGRSERWKYTDLRRYFAKPTRLADAPGVASQQDLERFLIKGYARAVFIDGFLSTELSDLEGVEWSALDEKIVGRVADIKSTGFVALNSVLLKDGFSLRVTKSQPQQRPIQLICLTSDKLVGEIHTRITIEIEENIEASICETHGAIGSGVGLCDYVIEIVLGKNARLQHVVHQQASKDIHHVVTRAGRIDEDAKFTGFSLLEGGALSRSETVLSLTGAGSEVKLYGIGLMRSRQHCDVTTDIIHEVSHCNSEQVFKNVVDGQGRTVFQGRVYVAPDVQGIEAHQLNRNLLLSKNARADSKPELIIHADDVKCSHGATVGDLDEEALFYLRSRGISENIARGILIRGFAAEMFEVLNDKTIVTYLDEALENWLLCADFDGGLA